VPAALVLGQFALLAEGKPAEYARFALFPALACAILACAVLPLFRDRRGGIPVGVVFCVMTAVFGGPYVAGFFRDTTPQNTRRTAAKWLSGDTSDLPLIAEPAPYSFPPVDLFKRKLSLVDPASPVRGALVTTDASRTPISWANKPFVLTK
jgi:hypothetical protein